MVKAILNNVEYDIPTNYSELTVGQYKRMASINKVLLDELNNTQKVASVLSAILNIGIKDVYLTTIPQFQITVEALSFLNESLEAIKDDEIKENVIIGGKEYFFKKDFDSMSVGEMISLEVYTQQDQSFINMLAPSLALTLREKDVDGNLKEFDANEYTKLVEVIENEVSIAEVYSMCAFFLGGGKTFTVKDSGDSSIKAE